MRDFLKHTFATVLGLLIFFGISIGAFVLLVVSIGSRETGPEVKDKSVLVFDLSLNITDAARNSSTSQAFQEAIVGEDNDSMTLRTVLDAINEASRDPRIVALYLSGNGEGTSSTGLAALKEVREALQRFRQAGKTIIAYDDNWREREYYLGSVANTVALNPSGEMEFNGLSSESAFYAGALRKFGVGIQVTRVGKYKAAVEPLLLTRRSPENREQTETLLRDVWNELLVAIGKERKLSPQQLQSIADRQGLLLAEEAKKRGLVDRVAYLDEVIEDLKKLAGKDSDEEKSFRQISIRSYADVAESAIKRKQSSDKQIAVIYAEGDIVSGQGGVGEVGGDRLARQLRQLRQDEDVKAVVLRVNSPGGSAIASDVIQREVILTRKKKPVIVSMGSLAASGGYWISTYADRIFAEPNTITGSIGVFGVQPNFQAIANNNGVTWDVVKTGRFADSQTVSRPKTPQELALLQKSVDQIYDQFLTKVSESRKLPKAKVAEIAQGRVWSGQRAKDLGLVDELGGLETAIQEAAKRAKLGDDWKIEEYPRSRSFEERLFEQFTGDQTSSRRVDPLMTQFKNVQSDLAMLRSMNDPRGVYARLPFNLRIE
ncbi:signal peptide peptidase SppA [Leptolyngbya sp. FACHB-36]|uniref:signal peptide peptidase SppA n=1 Tax=Leptolyngbya sp. FACHB-36 TaxID=2692808 RepID=UPI0016801E4C|nr:signal peptide peptidase SppA [Leptolyngbya sp. FACHB-36]MBD2021744.1 signal peptide peptidase SppA [Leptolyngbya sp. FACHB-36]